MRCSGSTFSLSAEHSPCFTHEQTAPRHHQKGPAGTPPRRPCLGFATHTTLCSQHTHSSAINTHTPTSEQPPTRPAIERAHTTNSRKHTTISPSAGSSTLPTCGAGTPTRGVAGAEGWWSVNGWDGERGGHACSERNFQTVDPRFFLGAKTPTGNTEACLKSASQAIEGIEGEPEMVDRKRRMEGEERDDGYGE